MGCDIHLYREKHVNGKWETADTWETEDYGDGDIRAVVPYESTYRGRNYDLFGLLAKGVRREFAFSFESRGMPLVVSDEVRKECEHWSGDGHSHSYLYLHELKELRDWLSANTIKISGMKDSGELAELRASVASGAPNWDLLYPYCGWGSGPSLVEFEIDAPASFIVGGKINQIIELFDGVDGDNHRIVFWFDN